MKNGSNPVNLVKRGLKSTKNCNRPSNFTLKSKWSLYRHSNLLESNFEISTIRFRMPNGLSLPLPECVNGLVQLFLWSNFDTRLYHSLCIQCCQMFQDHNWCLTVEVWIKKFEKGRLMFPWHQPMWKWLHPPQSKCRSPSN